MISVLIPCYNGAALIRRCLDSALSQTRKPCEVIIVNDGSTDNSAEVIASFGPVVRCVEQANAGPGAARNTGLRLATGKYVAFLDADDYWLPEFLEKCVTFLEAHPEAIAVSTGQEIKTWGHKAVTRPAILANGQGGSPRVLEDFFGFWGQHNHITTGSNVIRREIIAEAGGQRPDLRQSQDLEYWGYLATFGKWGFIPEPLFVGDGTAVAASQGWMSKHRLRWRLCPTVEQWEFRIVPRLKAEDWAGFRVMRGRIAEMVAHSKVLAGDDQQALLTVRKHGAAFPAGKTSKMLILGSATGWPGWRICCWLLRLRERVRAILISLTVNTKAKKAGREQSR